MKSFSPPSKGETRGRSSRTDNGRHRRDVRPPVEQGASQRVPAIPRWAVRYRRLIRTVAELRGGAKSLGERRREELETALRRYVVVPYDSAVVDVYATLHASKVQEAINRKDANDLWNAACAVAASPRLPLMTNNLADYKKIAEVVPLELVHPDL